MYLISVFKERIVEDEIIGESRISVDFTAEKLYISEITAAKIYRVDFDGKHKEVCDRCLIGRWSFIYVTLWTGCHTRCPKSDN